MQAEEDAIAHEDTTAREERSANATAISKGEEPEQASASPPRRHQHHRRIHRLASALRVLQLDALPSDESGVDAAARTTLMASHESSADAASSLPFYTPESKKRTMQVLAARKLLKTELAVDDERLAPAEERRCDKDGALCTKDDFLLKYGGTAEWEQAERPSPDAGAARAHQPHGRRSHGSQQAQGVCCDFITPGWLHALLMGAENDVTHAIGLLSSGWNRTPV